MTVCAMPVRNADSRRLCAGIALVLRAHGRRRWRHALRQAPRGTLRKSGGHAVSGRLGRRPPHARRRVRVRMRGRVQRRTAQRRHWRHAVCARLTDNSHVGWPRAARVARAAGHIGLRVGMRVRMRVSVCMIQAQLRKVRHRRVRRAVRHRGLLRRERGGDGALDLSRQHRGGAGRPNNAKGQARRRRHPPLKRRLRTCRCRGHKWPRPRGGARAPLPLALGGALGPRRGGCEASSAHARRAARGRCRRCGYAARRTRRGSRRARRLSGHKLQRRRRRRAAYRRAEPGAWPTAAANGSARSRSQAAVRRRGGRRCRQEHQRGCCRHAWLRRRVARPRVLCPLPLRAVHERGGCGGGGGRREGGAGVVALRGRAWHLLVVQTEQRRKDRAHLNEGEDERE